MTRLLPGLVCWNGLIADLPLGVFSKGKASVYVARLLIADAPGQNHAVLEVAVLQR